ncbi:MAG TPA: addiction module protein [Longimicrobium sp.]|jgi:putative addiction module component (TIGR02574 family)|uniref:addiction module protein n=1 Tax=Longimicrobium sp. TaxID=2029185 RepID=UPI002ED78A53
MSRSVHELEAAALRLTAAERADLAQRLFASVEDEQPPLSEAAVEQAWFDEAERRYDSYLAGEAKSVPAAEALARIRARLGVC